MDTLHSLFLSIVNMSITASVVIAVVILLRLPLKKAPRAFSYALWAVVLFRLLCPISFESPFSLVGGLNQLSGASTAGNAVEYISTQAWVPSDNEQQSANHTATGRYQTENSGDAEVNPAASTLAVKKAT